LSPFSASDLHSIVHPCVNALREPGHDDGLLSLEFRELIGLAVGRLQLEIRAGSPTFKSTVF
jgi:hypothetical protein